MNEEEHVIKNAVRKLYDFPTSWIFRHPPKLRSNWLVAEWTFTTRGSTAQPPTSSFFNWFILLITQYSQSSSYKDRYMFHLLSKKSGRKYTFPKPLHFLGIFPWMESQILIFLKADVFPRKRPGALALIWCLQRGFLLVALSKALGKKLWFLEKNNSHSYWQHAGETHTPSNYPTKRTLRNHGIFVFSTSSRMKFDGLYLPVSVLSGLLGIILLMVVGR